MNKWDLIKRRAFTLFTITKDISYDLNSFNFESLCHVLRNC